MKPTMTVAIATLLTLVVSSAMAGGKIYRATKPHWWTTPAMMCHPPNDEGANWCNAGAWQIRKLNGRGEDSLAAWGFLITPQAKRNLRSLSGIGGVLSAT